jgi:ketosteroid isomerase-like protein
MSEENVDRVRQMKMFRNRDRSAEAGFGERDLAAAVEALHPEIELDSTRSPMTDVRGKYHGLVEFGEFWRSFLEPWDTVEFDERVTDAGDYVLVSIERQGMRGKASGVEVSFPPYWIVFAFRDGQVIRQTFYLDRREALEAAGLSE